MNCRSCKNIINLMFDQRISDNELNAVLLHIEDCDDCRKHYYTVKNMIDDLREIKEEPLPEGFENKLHFALEREANAPINKVARLNRRLKVALSAVTGLVLLAGVVTILPNLLSKSDNFAANEAMPMEESAMDSTTEETTESEEEMYGIQDYARCEEGAPIEDGPASETTNKSADEEDISGKAQSVSESDGGINCICNALTSGSSIIIVIDVDDMEQAYNEISEYIPNQLDTEMWALNIEEPDEYLSLRSLGYVDEMGVVATRVVSEYSDDITSYYIELVEYENYYAEMEDLQDAGYIYVIIK